jgi:hypothetical protein
MIHLNDDIPARVVVSFVPIVHQPGHDREEGWPVVIGVDHVAFPDDGRQVDAGDAGPPRLSRAD